VKFALPETKRPKRFHIERLDGGIRISKNGHSHSNSLESSKNVWLSNGMLKTRPGIVTEYNRLLDNLDFQGFYHNYNTADIEISINGEMHQIITEEIEFDDSTYIYLTHFINSQGAPNGRAEMHFQRIDDSNFFRPSKIVFFKGAPQNGCGIFAFVKLVNIENYKEKTSHIYELDAKFSTWNRIVSTYIPTVYINGRGNMYEISSASNQAFKGTPTRLEKLNILNGRFHAYYSSDGHSSSFRLPFSNIADDTVECRFYYSLENYIEWVVEATETSATAQIDNVPVILNIDRSKGIFYFTVEAGDYELPLIGHQNENNIRITATKNTDYNLSDVASSVCALSANSKILLANNNVIFESDYKNPLYFPTDSVIVIGDSDTPITALSLKGGNVIAFKSEETHRIAIKNGVALNFTSLLADNDRVFFSSDSLYSKCISKEIGCKDKNSVLSYGGSFFWQSATGDIYTLNTSDKAICLSGNISHLIPSIFIGDSKSFAAKQDSYNLFLSNHSALIMYYNDKNPIWYYWEFPQDIYFIGAFTLNGKANFLIKSTEGHFCYTANLGGQEDVLLHYTEDYETYSLPIKTEIRSKKIPLGCNNMQKKITTILMDLTAEKVKISINDRLTANIRGPRKEGPVKLIPCINGCRTLDILLESDKPLELGSIDIDYLEAGL